MESAGTMGFSTLADLARIRTGVRRERLSSYDRAGGNYDWWVVKAGESARIAEIPGPGCIRHLWMTLWSTEPAFLRKVVLRAWWDGEAAPSVLCPIGDFFGIGHGIMKNFWSLPLQMSPQDGRSFNCWFPMPFSSAARLEVANDSASPINLYFYVDYDRLDRLDAGYGRFHAQWRRENPTDGWGDDGLRFSEHKDVMERVWRTPNLDGAGNYVILE
ncbi:MAG TPA: DUF2961 domain-containing protein, partial [Spirochaetia bacterium]|nr:DUF2961 domain-containing protein [Spirochaetia bacterium]